MSVVLIVIYPISLVILFESFSLFFLVSLAGGLSIFLIFFFPKNQPWFHWFICLLVCFLYNLFLLYSVFFLSFCWFQVLFVVLFLAPSGAKLGCVFEIFLAFWGSLVLLYTSLLEPLFYIPGVWSHCVFIFICFLVLFLFILWLTHSLCSSHY